MNNPKVRERIYMSRNKLQEMETDILNRRHVERYAMVRQWCKGSVLDISCGVGYGTFLISKNPDVTKVCGVDIDQETIDYANAEFKNKKTNYICDAIENYTGKHDMMISLETIEHLEDPYILKALADRCNIDLIFLSYPSKKTTHYNLYHYHDFNDDDVMSIFNHDNPDEFVIADVIDLHREVRILKLERC